MVAFKTQDLSVMACPKVHDMDTNLNLISRTADL
jgi:hypothetical protein